MHMDIHDNDAVWVDDIIVTTDSDTFEWHQFCSTLQFPIHNGVLYGNCEVFRWKDQTESSQFCIGGNKHCKNFDGVVIDLSETSQTEALIELSSYVGLFVISNTNK